MITLEIDNKDIDLAGAKIVLNKQAYILSDWLTRFVTFSERLVLPRVYFMRFGQYYNFKIKDNGQILFSGFAFLLAANGKLTSEVQLVDSSKLLFDRIQTNLNQLPLDQFDFTFNLIEYANRKLLSDSVWIWSAANFHQNRILSKNILSNNLAFYRPFFSVKKLHELIFNTNSWTYNLSENAGFMDKLLISSNHTNFYFTSYEKKFNLIQTITGTYNLDFSSPDFLKTDSISGGGLILNLNYKTKLRLRGIISATENFTISIIGMSSNVLIQQINILKGVNSYDITTNEFETSDPLFPIVINFIGNSDIELIDFYIYTLISESDFGALTLANFTDFKVKTYDNIPNISQIDLFKHSLIFAGGFFNTQNFKRQININSMNELSKLSAFDWSDKFIENSERETPVDVFAQNNFFNFNNSSNKPETQGNFSFDIVNETFLKSTDFYTSIFEASPEVEIDSKNILDTALYSDPERIGTSNALLSYYDVDGLNTLARFDKLNAEMIFSEFYANYIQAIQKNKFFESVFNLNKSDFYNFDFTRLIYVEQLKSNFYVISFDGYFENEPTKLILLKA